MPLTASGIHYQAAGAGYPLVFLHGVTLDRRMWRDQVAALRGTYRCITMDRRGHGRSQPLIAGYDAVGDADSVLAEARLTSCCVIGHSLGGWDAIRLAQRRPGVVQSMVLVDAWFPVPPMQWNPPVDVARNRGVAAGRAAWLADPLFEPAVGNTRVRRRLVDMVGANDLGLWVRDIPAAEQEVEPAELAAAIEAPTLVVAGALDLPGFIDVAHWLAAHIAGAAPPSVALVDGAGHMLPMEAPLAFNGLLSGFLAKHATASLRAG